MRSSVVALVIVGGLLAAAPAQAQSASDRAEKLFAEASTLVEKGQFAEACDKFAESQRLDPGMGTQYNLGLCYEKVGRLASAWRNFRDVQSLAHAAGKESRAQAAGDRADALRPRLSYVALSSADTSATIKVDGVEVKREDWSFVPLDPGDHTVDASAPGKKPWSIRVGVASGSTVKTDVNVPALVVMAPKIVTVTRETTNGRRTAAFVLGGIGLAGVATAAVTGVLVLNNRAIAQEDCSPGCSQRGNDAVSRGNTLLPINAIAWGVAALGLGVGTYLLVTAKPSAREASPKVSFAPLLDLHGAGALVQGSL